jgi:RNA polymerase sigma-70 factor (ECF subfamily)
MNRKPDDILDEMLVLRVQGGDRRALTQLISRWQSRLQRRAQQITGRQDVTADLVQDAWLAIIRGLRRLNDPGTFRSWAYRIIHNKSVDWVRQQSRNRELNSSLDEVSADKDTTDSGLDHSSSDGTQRLRKAIRQLNTEQQVLLRMYYTDELSLKEIAFITGVATGTLKYRLFR